jgi:hypothetical protein
MRANSVLQFAGMLSLILWSSLRKLDWPEHELRIATGLGISAFAWFVVALLHAQWDGGPVYHRLDQAGEVADLVVLAYWLHYFLISAPREDRERNSAEERDGRRSHDESQKVSRLDLARDVLARESSFRANHPLSFAEILPVMKRVRRSSRTNARDCRG